MKRARAENVFAETSIIELWKIDKERFFGILEKFPEIKQYFYDTAEKRNRVRGYVTKTS